MSNSEEGKKTKSLIIDAELQNPGKRRRFRRKPEDGDKLVAVTIRLPAKARARLNEEARRRGMSVNWILLKCISTIFKLREGKENDATGRVVGPLE